MQSAQRKLSYNERQRPQPKKRVVKMDGNVAYVNSGFAKNKVRQPRKAAKKKVKPAKGGVGMTLFVLFVAFCALALLVSRYAVVCSIGSSNNELEQQIESIEARIDNLSVELELKDDLYYVHNAAQDELGMMYPDQSQKISISLDG